MQYLSIAMTIICCVITVINFFGNKKDKDVDNTKKDANQKIRDNGKQVLIEYRLDELTKKVDKILDILDGYDKEIERIVEKRLEEHILIYHKGEK